MTSCEGEAKYTRREPRSAKSVSPLPTACNSLASSGLQFSGTLTFHGLQGNRSPRSRSKEVKPVPIRLRRVAHTAQTPSCRLMTHNLWIVLPGHIYRGKRSRAGRQNSFERLLLQGFEIAVGITFWGRQKRGIAPQGCGQKLQSEEFIALLDRSCRAVSPIALWSVMRLQPKSRRLRRPTAESVAIIWANGGKERDAICPTPHLSMKRPKARATSQTFSLNGVVGTPQP